MLHELSDFTIVKQPQMFPRNGRSVYHPDVSYQRISKFVLKENPFHEIASESPLIRLSKKKYQQLGCKYPEEHGQRIYGGIAYG